jgi:hypothetical protein
MDLVPGVSGLLAPCSSGISHYRVIEISYRHDRLKAVRHSSLGTRPITVSDLLTKHIEQHGKCQNTWPHRRFPLSMNPHGPLRGQARYTSEAPWTAAGGAAVWIRPPTTLVPGSKPSAATDAAFDAMLEQTHAPTQSAKLLFPSVRRVRPSSKAKRCRCCHCWRKSAR